MRAPFGELGARALTSPYRVVASTYWFAAQALVAAFGIQAIADALSGSRPPLVPTALAIAVVQAAVAALGFDVMRWLLRLVLPLSVGSALVLVGLWLAADEPAYDVGRVLDAPEQELTWLGFATVVTVMCGSSLTLVTNISDLCRYSRSRRDMRLGLISSTLAATTVTTLVGAVFAAGGGEANPFVAASELTSSDLILCLLLVAVVVQTFAANLTNVYTAGLSLVSSLPGLGRLRATILVGAAAVVLSAFPSLIEEAQDWITHLGNLAAPITGVVLADYLVRRRGRLDVAALYASSTGRRLRDRVDLAALAAVAAGTAAYSLVPHAWLKVVWGAATGAAVLLLARRVAERSTSR